MRTVDKSLAQFAKEVGGCTEADVQSHLHAGMRSLPNGKSAKLKYMRELGRLWCLRTKTTRLYQAAIESGDFKRPGKPTLEEIASGHPDNPSTQAAARLIAKKYGTEGFSMSAQIEPTESSPCES